MALKISQLTPVAVGTLDGSEPVELGIAGDKSAPNGAFLPAGYINGLKLVWVSGTALTVTSGAAYIPSLGRVIRLGANAAKAGLALAASTWYHVYLYLNAGVPDVEIVTTAPAAAYNGTARTKTGDTSRRYIASVLTDAGGNVRRFSHLAATGTMLYPDVGAQLRVLSNGGATTSTVIDCSTAIPVTAVAVGARFLNNAASGDTCWFGPGDTTISPSAYFLAVGSSGATAFQFASVDASQKLAYIHSVATSGAYVDPYGYIFER